MVLDMVMEVETTSFNTFNLLVENSNHSGPALRHYLKMSGTVGMEAADWVSQFDFTSDIVSALIALWNP